MIVADQKKLFYLLGVLSIFLLPFMFLNLPSWYETINKYIFLLIIVEYFIYLFVGLWQTAGKQVVYLLIYSAVMFIIRINFCIFGGLIYSFFGQSLFAETFIQLWIGNPISQLLQILLLIYFVPYVAIYVAPGLIRDENKKLIFSQDLQKQKSETQKEVGHFAEPLGGFIRVYSYPELQSCFRKTIGLEGFIIYSSDGLIVWEDLAINFDIDNLVIKFLQLDRNIDMFIKDFEFNVNEKLILDTPEHMLINVKLNEYFYLIAFFNKKIQISEMIPRMKVLIKSTQELIKSKYQLLYNFK